MTRVVAVPSVDNRVQDDPGDILELVCDQHQNMTLRATVGRARVLGWAVWDGITLAGVTSSRTLCPSCTGRAADGVEFDEDHEPGEPFGWNGTCEACDADMWIDWGTEEMPPTGWTEADVREWFDDHDCEPVLHLIPPRARQAVPA